MKTFVLFITLSITISLNAASSPYRRNDTASLTIYSASALMFASGYLLSLQEKPGFEHELTTLDKDDVNSFDRSATENYSTKLADTSDIMLGSFALTPLFYLFDSRINQDFLLHASIYTETQLSTLSLVYAVKNMITRYRPYTYNPELSLEDKMKKRSTIANSFYSGHTTLAFSTASFITHATFSLYGNRLFSYFFATAAYSAASVVGYLRYASGSHFPSDILTGALVGSACGLVIPWLHLKKSSTTLTFNPLKQGGYLSVTYLF